LIKLRTITRAVDRVGNVIMIAGMAVMTMVIMVNIFMRFFGESLLGTYEVVQLASVVVVSLAVVYTALKRMHIAVEILTSRLPQRARMICYITGRSLSAITCAMLTWAVATYAWKGWVIGEQTSTLEIFLPPFRFFWALGCALLCLVFITHIFEVPEK
jgi:TRAP-type C4-dicarboxylate transport system permease small subunit